MVGADAAIHGVVAVAAVERIAERAAGQTTGQRVIAATADQSVGILAAVERIVVAVADDLIGGGVADAEDRIRILQQGQVVVEGEQRIAHRADHGVDAAADLVELLR